MENYEIHKTCTWNPHEKHSAVFLKSNTVTVTQTYWLLVSFSLMVEKSMGFLMTFLYPGTALWLTGVRKGQASWWASSSASSTLERTSGKQGWLSCTCMTGAHLKKNDIFLTVRRGRVNVLRMQWECVHAYRHTASPYVLLSFAVLAFFAGLSCLAWELGELSSPFLFLNSLVPFFGTLLLLAASSLMSSPTADGLLFRLTSLPFLPPPAVRLCCFLLRGEWPLSWQSTQKKRTKHIIFKSISLDVYMWYSYVHHLTTTWDEAPLDLL